jgi:hypothetical protein
MQCRKMPTLFDHLVGTGEQRRRVLMIGQLLQIAGLVMLSALDPAWSAMLAVGVGGRRARHCGLGEGFHKDGLQIGDQGDEFRGSVGFYYAANASGRLMGTLLSGLLYHVGGMTGCLVGSAAMLALCWLITLLLPTTVREPVMANQPA